MSKDEFFDKYKNLACSIAVKSHKQGRFVGLSVDREDAKQEALVVLWKLGDRADWVDKHGDQPGLVHLVVYRGLIRKLLPPTKYKHQRLFSGGDSLRLLRDKSIEVSLLDAPESLKDYLAGKLITPREKKEIMQWVSG